MNYWFRSRYYVLQILHGCLNEKSLLERAWVPYVAAQQRRTGFGSPPANSKKEGLMTPFRTIAEKVSAWRRYREAVRELSQLTDRELEDIGVRRGDIPFIAAGAVRKAA